MSPVTTSGDLVDVDVGDRERNAKMPYRKAALREINAFASYIGNQFFGTNNRRYPTTEDKGFRAIDMAHFEEEMDGVESNNLQRLSHDGHRNCNKRSTLRSPRSILQKMIPNNTSQRAQMDLLLLDEAPCINDLRKCAWKGCSPKNRAQVWRLLLGHEPLKYNMRQSTLQVKRRAYQEYVTLLCAPEDAAEVELSRQIKHCREMQREYENKSNTLVRDKRNLSQEKTDDITEYSDYAMKTLRQIEMDLPRTHPTVPIFHVPEVRNPMRRILYIHGMLNPNISYVQGMNELLTPVVVVFLSNYLKQENDKGIESFISRDYLPDLITEQELEDMEADAFWTFSVLVSCIEDNFVAEQTGILRRIARLEEIVLMVDPALTRHLGYIGIEFIQFSYRWMNCLLIRELPFTLVVKLWDALFAEENGLTDLQVYFCAAMIIRYRLELMSKGFEKCIMFLQHLPTSGWKTSDIDELLCQAHVWKRELQLQSLA